MEITTTRKRPFNRLTLIVDSLSPTEVLTAQNNLSKYCFVEAILNHTSVLISRISDQGHDFMSELIKNLCSLVKTKHNHSPYYLQTNRTI